jgi:hypothetical protein
MDKALWLCWREVGVEKMRFIHTADWQIGKVFKQYGAKEETLRQARLVAIERLGELARTNGVQHILVAGDVYDNEAPNTITLRAPIERMKPFADIHWHLLPGNHDPHRPEGVWDRVAQLGLPSHIHVHLTPAPVPLTDGAFLLPAPLLRKSEFDDLTVWMDSAATPAGALRIGLAHGAVINFTSEGEATNPIDPARSAKANLDYLALGDWHRTLQIGPAVWYAGTPEPDRAGRQERGTALLVLRSEQDLSRLILRLKLEGTLPLAAHAELQRRLVDLEAAVFHLDLDQTALVARPTEADLEAIDFDGVLRRSADRLKAMVDDPAQNAETRRRAEDALIDLYLRVVDQQQGKAA